MFQYELAKIFRRRAVIVTLLAFFAVNVYNLFTVHSDPQADWSDDAFFAAQQVIVRSMEGPITDESAARIMKRYEELQNGTGSKEYVSGSRGVDLQIYENQVAQLKAIYDYRLRADTLKESIQNRLQELEGSGHTYEIRRLELMERVYASRAITDYYDTTGFSSPFYYSGYDFSSLLAVLLLLIGVTPLFSAEREYGMDVLLKTSRRGRRHTVWAKLVAAATFSAVSGLMLFVSDLVYFESVYSFDLWHAPIYGVPAYYNTPLNLTIGGFILLIWAAKIAGLWVTALVIALLSSLCRRTHFAFFFGAGYLFAMMGAGDRLMMLNPLSLMTFADYTKTFRTVNLLGYPVLTIAALPVTMLLVGAALGASIHLSERRTRERRVELPKEKGLLRWERAVASGGGEWRKRLVKQRMAVLILLVTGLKSVLVLGEEVQEYFVFPSDRIAYAQALDRLGDESLDAVDRFLADEEGYIAADKAYTAGLGSDLAMGLLGADEYAAALDSYEQKAHLSAAVLYQLRSDCEYAALDPAHRRLADTRGWDNLMDSGGMDLPAVLVAAVVCGVSFSFEWESGMADLLRTTRDGRRRLARRKMLVSALLTAGIWLVFEAAAFAAIAIRYPLLTYWGYPLQTLHRFGEYAGVLTIGQAYLLSRLLRLLGLWVVQGIASAVSAGTQRSLTAVFSATSVAVIPYFLLREGSGLYTLPTPAGLLCGTGFFALPGFSAVQWLFLALAAAAAIGLWRFAVERYSAGGRSAL